MRMRPTSSLLVACALSALGFLLQNQRELDTALSDHERALSIY